MKDNNWEKVKVETFNSQIRMEKGSFDIYVRMTYVSFNQEKEEAHCIKMKWGIIKIKIFGSLSSITTIRSLRSLSFIATKKEKKKVCLKICKEEEVKETTVDRWGKILFTNVIARCCSIDAIRTSWRG